jgi:hypothetical protein
MYKKGGANIKNHGFNPYLPSWEYVPDGEPYVFDGRVYVYGSHDKFNGYVFCMNDYVCWSAPEDDLTDWRCEGVIYKKTDDPLNPDGSMCLYAPDVTAGPDGRYYLYYVLDKVSVVSVAVCDTPAGKYEFYGYVHYADGTKLGDRDGDEPQFDPGVLTEGGRTYLYTGFCGHGDRSRHGAMATVLDADMLTVLEAPVFVVPGKMYAEGSGFIGHEFFEAPSIRKIGDMYYLIYSSSVMHELCYATSKNPTGGFVFGGVIISNCDMHVDTYKPAEKQMYPPGNNHGSIVEIRGKWYIFYHRQTNGNWYSRQGCLEKLAIAADGSIKQAEMTSCGPADGPLAGKGRFPAYIACNLFLLDDEGAESPSVMHRADAKMPKITQDGKDGDEEAGYIANVGHTATAGFKYFTCEGITKVKIETRGYAKGVYEVKLSWDGEPLGTIATEFSNIWKSFEADITIPDGLNSLYFTFKGHGSAHFGSFTLE